MIVYDTATSELPPSIHGLVWGDGYAAAAGLSAITGDVYPLSALAPSATSGGGSESYSFTKIVISTDSDYSTDIAAGASGTFNIDGVKISGSASYRSKVTYSSTSMTVIARCILLDNGYETLESVALTDKAKQLLDSNQNGFRQKYGDYFIYGMKSGSELNIVFTCTTTSESKLHQFKTSVSASDADLFSASGYLDFTSAAKSHDVSTSMTVFFGALKEGAQPPTAGTPKDYLNFFKANYAKVAQYATVVLYPGLSPTVDVSPATFGQVKTLYQEAWLVKNRFDTCPGVYASAFEESFNEVFNQLEVSKPSLVQDPSQISGFLAKLEGIKSELDDVFNRFDVFQQALGAREAEPAVGHNMKAPNAQFFSYGVTASSAPGVTLSRTTTHHITGHGIGHHTYNFTLGSTSETLIVGFSVQQNRLHHGGHWVISNKPAILSNTATIQVGSDNDRAADYTVTGVTVKASEYQFGDASDKAVAVDVVV